MCGQPLLSSFASKNTLKYYLSDTQKDFKLAMVNIHLLMYVYWCPTLELFPSRVLLQAYVTRTLVDRFTCSFYGIRVFGLGPWKTFPALKGAHSLLRCSQKLQELLNLHIQKFLQSIQSWSNKMLGRRTKRKLMEFQTSVLYCTKRTTTAFEFLNFCGQSTCIADWIESVLEIVLYNCK